MYAPLAPEVPTTVLYLPTILSREACAKHKVPVGIPCFHILPGYDSQNRLAGVCDKRARRAGFNHPIGANSLRMNRRK